MLRREQCSIDDLWEQRRDDRPSDGVAILRFKRFEKFNEIFMESTEFKACRDALEDKGFSSDLSVHGLGRAKLLVRADLAWATLGKLKEIVDPRPEAKLCLRSTDIVVSPDHKAHVLEVVKRLSPRCWLVSDTPLELFADLIEHEETRRKKGELAKESVEALTRLLDNLDHSATAANAAAGRPKEPFADTHSVPVSQVFFTHDSIKDTFSYRTAHAGQPLESLVNALRSGTTTVDDPRLVLDGVMHDGRLYCLRNRRLYCLKQYARQLGIDISIRIRRRNDGILDKSWKTTTNMGTDVRIRSNVAARVLPWRGLPGRGLEPWSDTSTQDLGREQLEKEDILPMKKAARIKLEGFGCLSKNGVYTESQTHMINGHKVWWQDSGLFFFYHGADRRWNLGPLSRLEEIEHGALFCLGIANGRPSEADLWGEFGSERKKDSGEYFVYDWNTHVDLVQVKRSIPSNVCPGLMDVVVDVRDESSKTFFSKLLMDSFLHHDRSGCDNFMSGVDVKRVLRIENDELWRMYLEAQRDIKSDLERGGLIPAQVEPPLSSASLALGQEYGPLDPDVNEVYLFHGAPFSTAVKIALGGFGLQLKNAGLFGFGSHFASEPCKSHMYTARYDSYVEMRTLIVCRVVVGDPWYADRIDRHMTLPPKRRDSERIHDSTIVDPGVMPGHVNRTQMHREFVVFKSTQAYPAFIIQYNVIASIASNTKTASLYF